VQNNRNNIITTKGSAYVYASMHNIYIYIYIYIYIRTHIWVCTNQQTPLPQLWLNWTISRIVCVWIYVLRRSEVTQTFTTNNFLKNKFLLINIRNYYNYVSIRYALHLRRHAVFCRLNSKPLWRENWVLISKKWLQIQVRKICIIIWNTWSVPNYFKVKITTSSSACCDYSSSRRPTSLVV